MHVSVRGILYNTLPNVFLVAFGSVKTKNAFKKSNQKLRIQEGTCLSLQCLDHNSYLQIKMMFNMRDSFRNIADVDL